MKKLLQLLALLVVLAASVTWAAAGANRGWTKTSVPHKATDEVTGIEAITYEKKFIPGVELLGMAVAISAVLAGASFLFRNKKPGNPSNP